MVFRFAKGLWIGCLLAAALPAQGQEDCSFILTPSIHELATISGSTARLLELPEIETTWSFAPSVQDVVLAEPRETDSIPEMLVSAGGSQPLAGRGRNGVHDVVVSGRHEIFKPKSGESPGVGKHYLGPGYAPGMMTDREVFAARVFGKIGWRESARARLARLEHDGVAEDGALVDWLPGQSAAELGLETFRTAIARSKAYALSRERALVMALAMGNQDWIYFWKGQLKINGGNLLVHSPEGTAEPEFYWIDNGAACPLRARLQELPRDPEKYIRRHFGLLWPLIDALGPSRGGLHAQSLWLIAKLEKLGLSDYRELGRGLESIQDGDIRGIQVRVHYLYERFVRGMAPVHNENTNGI